MPSISHDASTAGSFIARGFSINTGKVGDYLGEVSESAAMMMEVMYSST